MQSRPQSNQKLSAASIGRWYRPIFPIAGQALKAWTRNRRAFHFPRGPQRLISGKCRQYEGIGNTIVGLDLSPARVDIPSPHPIDVRQRVYRHPLEDSMKSIRIARYALAAVMVIS